MADFNWTCPHCNRDVTISDSRRSVSWHTNSIENAIGRCTLISTFYVCPNPQCKKHSLFVSLFESKYDPANSKEKLNSKIQKWNLIPQSNAKPFPDYIPQPIISDYNEACLIKDLSPKASATLARRCLQGIIRDYWGVNAGSLHREVEAIKDKVDPLTWDAIDAVRKIGNIGAHMERDINLIVDVESHEAELLINLIETLLKDWYVAREERKARLLAISEIAEKKDNERKGINEIA